MLLYFFRYTKLRVFALKLKKKLKETVEQLQMVQDDKVKLEKLIIENNTVNEDKKDTIPVSPAEINKSENSSDNQAAIIELQNKLKSLSTELEAASEFKAEVTKLKGKNCNVLFAFNGVDPNRLRFRSSEKKN